MDSLISERINQALAEKVFPGCSIAYFKNGKREILSFGALTYEDDARKVDAETMYGLTPVYWTQRSKPFSVILP